MFTPQTAAQTATLTWATNEIIYLDASTNVATNTVIYVVGVALPDAVTNGTIGAITVMTNATSSLSGVLTNVTVSTAGVCTNISVSR